ncbi:uncharacterized protein METZ01_LOCUS330308, partial [marine metagenome]
MADRGERHSEMFGGQGVSKADHRYVFWYFYALIEQSACGTDRHQIVGGN